MIDTLAGEWPAQTNYLYLTYRADADDVRPMPEGSVLVLGAGPSRIGSSVEFDWSTMNLVDGLKAEGSRASRSSTPTPRPCPPTTTAPTGSTSRRSPSSGSRDIYEFEQFRGVVTCVGSQLAQNLTPLLHMCGIPILGHASESIDTAEDRARFARPPRAARDSPARLAGVHDRRRGERVRRRGRLPGPRPALVRAQRAGDAGDLGAADLGRFLSEAARVSPGAPGRHHEVHRGRGRGRARRGFRRDAGAGRRDPRARRARRASTRETRSSACPRGTRRPRCRASSCDGRAPARPDARDPRAVQRPVPRQGPAPTRSSSSTCGRAARSPSSRRRPGSRSSGEAARAMLGRPLSPRRASPHSRPGRWGVKVPQFSFLQLTGSDPLLGVEMQSTGEVACFGPTFSDALVKALVATGRAAHPRRGTAFLSVGRARPQGGAPPDRPPAAGPRPPHRGHRGHRGLPHGPRVPRRPRPPQGLRARPPPERARGARRRRASTSCSTCRSRSPRRSSSGCSRTSTSCAGARSSSGIPLFTSLEAFAAYVEGVAWLEEHPLTVDALYGTPGTRRRGREPRPGPRADRPATPAAGGAARSTATAGGASRRAGTS